MLQKLNCEIAVIGIDIGKNSFHIVGQDQRGAIVLRQKWSRGQVESRLANLLPCLIGMEARESRHYSLRELCQLRHTACIVPATYVKACKCGKSDAIDAEAIREAATHPTMRFVLVNSVDQQAIIMRHRTRDLLMRQHAMLANAFRWRLAGFGVAAASELWGTEELLAMALAVVHACNRAGHKCNTTAPESKVFARGAPSTQDITYLDEGG